MSHPTFESPSEDIAQPFWWQALRDLGIALVVVVAIALISGFLILPPVHAQEHPASALAGGSPAQSAVDPTASRI